MPEQVMMLSSEESSLPSSPPPPSLNHDREKHFYTEEIRRLKSHLVKLDEEISEEAKQSGQRIEQLEQELDGRDRLIFELQSKLEKCNGQVLDELEEENLNLYQTIRNQERTIEELGIENNNLQEALGMLQENMEREVNAQLLGYKQTIHQLEEKQTKLDQIIVSLKTENQRSKDENSLVDKLSRDIDARNYLIDQLNDEINEMKQKKKLTINDRDDDGDRDGYIDKTYTRSLLLQLAKPPKGISRIEIWKVLAKALVLDQEEIKQLGIKTPSVISLPTSPTTIHQGLSDVWISFLLHELQNNN